LFRRITRACNGEAMQHSAYPVPFRFERDLAPAYPLINVGEEQLRGIMLTLNGAGLMPSVVAAALDPGEVLTVQIRGDDLALPALDIIDSAAAIPN
jgi:hypothetical protein